VSSFLAAAAALQVEYTLPDVSQTVILTRMEGRTPVPEKEGIGSLSSHQATMCIFLSVHMLGELIEKLKSGGYSGDTPMAIVEKASWPDQKIFRGTLDTMLEVMKDEDVPRTAMVVVGNALGNEYEKSKLYDPEFTHMFRKGESK
jgi:precorrin-4/cobalt-precorrin-4 C11-methyltransferase